MSDSSVMEILAENKRRIYTEQRKYQLFIYSRDIKRMFRKQGMYSPNAEKILEEAITRTGISLGIWNDVLLKAIIDLIGDPMLLAKEHMKHHSVPYWNPTSTKINILPLGLPRFVNSIHAIPIEAQDYVLPGDRIMIPAAYTVGGKYSSVQGVAPQLKPLLTDIDDLLEVGPTTYTEWCSFMPSGVKTYCCNKEILWSEHHGLLCGKCGERQDGY